jgi:hypothetical protein
MIFESQSSSGLIKIGIYRKEMTSGFTQRPQRIRSGRNVKFIYDIGRAGFTSKSNPHKKANNP